jgi:S1-C subfamily serine protease
MYTGLLALAAIITLLAPTHPSSSFALSARQLDLISEAPVDPAADTTVVPSLVQINTSLDYQNAIGSGAGIVLNPNGEVLTNNHVVAGATSITATAIGDGRTYPVDVIGYDRTNDVALVQLRGAGGLPAAPIGDSSQVRIGEQTISYGNADGTGNPPTREPGSVIGLNQTVRAEDDLTGSSQQLNGLIEIAGNLRPGDSGGPTVNSSGQVIGLNTAGSGNYRVGTAGGHGFVIPVNKALSIANQIRSRNPSGTVHIGDTAMLGVGVVTARQGGVLVRQVLRGGPADQAGIAPGAAITSVDGNRVDNANTLTDLLDHRYPGDTVNLTWVDQSGQQRNAKVTLATGPVG